MSLWISNWPTQANAVSGMRDAGFYELHHHGNKARSPVLCIQGISWLQFHVPPPPPPLCLLTCEIANMLTRWRLSSPLLCPAVKLCNAWKGKIHGFKMDFFPTHPIRINFWKMLKNVNTIDLQNWHKWAKPIHSSLIIQRWRGCDCWHNSAEQPKKHFVKWCVNFSVFYCCRGFFLLKSYLKR